MTTTSFRACTASWPFQTGHVSVQVYFSQFRKTPFGMLRLDPQDAGPGYRNVIGIPGGVNSPLFRALQVLCLLQSMPDKPYRILLGLRSYSTLGSLSWANRNSANLCCACASFRLAACMSLCHAFVDALNQALANVAEPVQEACLPVSSAS